MLFFCIFLITSLKFFRVRNKGEAIVILFVGISSIIASIIEVLTPLRVYRWEEITIAISLCIYYSYMHMQIVKRDPLTGVLNRQSYYKWCEKYTKSITALISIDMNELKWINDNKGHEAGDEAIKVLSRCINNIKYETSKTEYSCAIGYAMKGFDYDIKKMIKIADERMYEDKLKMKKQYEDSGQVLHVRM